MSLIDLLGIGRGDASTAVDVPVLDVPPPAPDPDAVVYLLDHHPSRGPAAGDWAGWTLAARHGTGWSWSMALGARGAGAHAPPRVAQAVAVRVLAEHGVTVEGWSDPDSHPDLGGDEPTGGLEVPVGFRARALLPPSPAVPSPAPGRLSRRVPRQRRGH